MKMGEENNLIAENILKSKNLICTRCGSKTIPIKKRKCMIRYNACGKQFSIYNDTIFEYKNISQEA